MRIGEFELIDPIPEMENTIAISMLRPWIDVGRVGTLALRKLQKHINAQEFAKLHTPGKFFDFTRYRPRTKLVDGKKTFIKPNTIIQHGYDSSNNQHFLFLHIREPHNFSEEYTNSIVELLKFCDVKEYCRIGGMYDSVPHTRPIRITGNLKEDQQIKASGLINPRRSTYQGPTSIVNQVNEDLDALNVFNTTLMAHLPQYVQLDEDHLGTARLLEVLCSVYGFPMELADKTQGNEQYDGINDSIDYGGEMGNLIKQLEMYYDRVLSKSEERLNINDSSSKTDFSEDVQDFLNQMGERFEDNINTSDDDMDKN
tara:strand:- start:4791 stop:5729 length:939 start_codon:yes stop_codon:yes gene_type:complete